MGGAESKDSSKRDGDDPGSDLGTDCENRTSMVSAGVAAAGLALLGAAVAGGVALASRASNDDDRKTMKAPGRSDERIYREDFEENPGQYFRDLRKKGLVDAGGVTALAGRDSDDRKTMKAPGRSDDRIYRDDFEENPGQYFRDLRKK